MVPRTSMTARTPVEIEVSLQRLVTAYVAAGLLYLLLPGTFLGVWNLVSISGRHSLAGLPPAWVQAHGHAQVYGWIGTFIIGIGYYSLSKMGGLAPFAATRGWVSWVLWTGGAGLRWTANVTEWQWRALLPLSAVMQLAAFVIFFATVSRHRPHADGQPKPRIETWMKLVMASTGAFLLALVANLGLTLLLASAAEHPEVPHALDQRYLFLAAWGFPVLAVWGFSARWLPVFLGLREVAGRGLLLALGLSGAGLPAAVSGLVQAASLLLLAAAVTATLALGVWRPSVKPPKTQGVTPAFPLFVRLAYVWLWVAAALGVYASLADTHGGIWGASRHALTVGFLATMVFAIGQRVLPAFCGMRVLWNTRLMFASLALLNLGCVLRVSAQVPAYEWNLAAAWSVLPVSAVTELIAVSLFAVNLGVTLILPPPRPAVIRIGVQKSCPSTV